MNHVSMYFVLVLKVSSLESSVLLAIRKGSLAQEHLKSFGSTRFVRSLDLTLCVFRRGSGDVMLWSKFQTGQPRDLPATERVSETIVGEIEAELAKD